MNFLSVLVLLLILKITCSSRNFTPSSLSHYLLSDRYVFRFLHTYSNIYPTRCNVTQFIYIWELFYIFRVVPPHIIRSAYNCIYNIWYMSDRYCYLPLQRSRSDKYQMMQIQLYALLMMCGGTTLNIQSSSQI